MKPLKTLGWAACAFALAVAVTPNCMAETLLELDFQNFNVEGRTTMATAAYAGASKLFRLSESDATINPTEPTGIATKNAALKTGFVELQAGGEGGGFLDAIADPDEKASPNYSAYVGGNGYGTATMVFVFQPIFSGPRTGQSSGQRAYLFTNGFFGTAAQSVTMAISQNIELNFGMGNVEVQRTSLAQPDWDPGKWYFLALSWGEAQAPTIYVREIGAAKGAFTARNAPLVDLGENIKKAVRLGNTAGHEANTGGGSPADGKLAYILWTSDYLATQAEYDKLYTDIVKP